MLRQQADGVEHLAAGVESMLNTMFSQVSCTISVAGRGAIELTDSGVVGCRMVSFSIAGGKVALSAARNERPRDFREYLPGCEGDECSVLELLLAAPCFQRRLSSEFGYLPQFVWVLAPLLETSLLGVNLLRGGRDWMSSSSLVGLGSELARHERAPFAYAYSEANAKSFSDSTVLCVAVDDGRVGRTPWKVGAVMDPADNYAAWLVPQAILAQFSQFASASKGCMSTLVSHVFV